MNYLILQNIPQPSYAIIANTEHVWSNSRTMNWFIRREARKWMLSTSGK